MATPNAVWGIDIGQCGLKAVKLRPAGDGMFEAVAFDFIEHPKILSQPDANRDELVASALEKFASRNEWQGDKFVVGVPGQQTFARFCKMPPIDLKKDARKIPELVRYEASQQIPFDMDDVVWDYQVFANEDLPDIEVGIFAIRKDLIRKHLEFFNKVGIGPIAVQTIPGALYNYCNFDFGALPPGKARVVVDVGAQNTDLIIIEPNAAWTRNIPLGGNNFTDALVRSFKLSFAKAESLKRSAASSKYARQIFQAMRPVFADLVAEIQRSLGFYTSTHRDLELMEVIALGNAFRLPGLQKYLENNLTVAGGVRKVEKFEKLVPSATTNAPQFTENILTLAAAYGLALQGLGEAKIKATLLPPELARVALWKKKTPYFIGTAAALLVAAAIPYGANALDMAKLDSPRAEAARGTIEAAIREAEAKQQEYSSASTDTAQKEQQIKDVIGLQDPVKKALLPRLLATIHGALPPLNQPELANVQDGAELRKLIKADPARFPRTERGQLRIEVLEIRYADDVTTTDLASAAPSASPTRAPGFGMPGVGGPPPGVGAPPGMGGPAGMGAPPSAGGAGGDSTAAAGLVGNPTENSGFIVTISGTLLYGQTRSDASRWLQGEYFSRLRQQMQQPGLGFHIPPADPDPLKRSFSEPLIRNKYTGETPVGPRAPMAPEGGVTTTNVDPVTEEDRRYDWDVSFTFKVKLGEAPPPGTADAASDPNQPGQ